MRASERKKIQKSECRQKGLAVFFKNVIFCKGKDVKP